MVAKITISPGNLMAGTRLTYLRDVTMAPSRICDFRCECGVVITRKLAYVRHLNTASCGCLRREMRVAKNTKHGRAVRSDRSGSYRSWAAMHQRVKCNPRYSGVQICERWSGNDGYRHFLSDMGERPIGCTIDRIDNKGNYQPDNCRWATKVEQANNTSANVLVPYCGSMVPQAELMVKFGISYSLVKHLRRKGMGLTESITTPINKNKSHKGAGL